MHKARLVCRDKHRKLQCLCSVNIRTMGNAIWRADTLFEQQIKRILNSSYVEDQQKESTWNQTYSISCCSSHWCHLSITLKELLQSEDLLQQILMDEVGNTPATKLQIKIVHTSKVSSLKCESCSSTTDGGLHKPTRH